MKKEMDAMKKKKRNIWVEMIEGVILILLLVVFVLILDRRINGRVITCGKVKDIIGEPWHYNNNDNDIVYLGPCPLHGNIVPINSQNSINDSDAEKEMGI